MNYELFISYSRKDKVFVKEFCDILELYRKHYDFEYFFDTEDIRARDSYVDKISNSIAASRSVLFIASKNSLKSKFCSLELHFAFNHDVKIFVYRLDNSKFPNDIDLLLGTSHHRFVSNYAIGQMAQEILQYTLKQNVKPIEELDPNAVRPSLSRRFKRYVALNRKWILTLAMLALILTSYCVYNEYFKADNGDETVVWRKVVAPNDRVVVPEIQTAVADNEYSKQSDAVEQNDARESGETSRAQRANDNYNYYMMQAEMYYGKFNSDRSDRSSAESAITNYTLAKNTNASIRDVAKIKRRIDEINRMVDAEEARVAETKQREAKNNQYLGYVNRADALLNEYESTGEEQKGQEALLNYQQALECNADKCDRDYVENCIAMLKRRLNK